MSSIYGIKTSNIFTQNYVIELTEGDFNLDTRELITLKYDDCIISLFHTQNKESQDLMKIWILTSQQVVGPVFAACDLERERKVAEAFTSLNLFNSSLRWAGLKGIPFILTYQNGWPIGFYNGERAVQPLLDYSLTLACRSDYFEPENIPASIQSDNNYEMKGWKSYKKYRNNSSEYKVSDPIRKYDNNSDVILFNPQEESSQEES